MMSPMMSVGLAGYASQSQLMAAAPSFDYYVDATLGNDGNQGASASPWQTLGRVVAELAKYAWLDTVRVYIAAGTYAGVQWNGANFIPGGKLGLIATSTTVLSNGTVTAASTKVLLNSAAYGGTNNLWRKSLRRKTAGGVMLDERSITANTATTLQPAVPFTTVPAAGELWEVFEPAVVFDYSAFPATSQPVWLNWNPAGDYQEFVNTNHAIGGIYLVDIRIALGANIRADWHGSAYLKSVELTTTANNDVEVWNASAAFTRAGTANPIFAGTTTLSFLGVTNDDQWCGCGLHVLAPNVPSGTYSLRANGNFDGIFCVPGIYPNLRTHPILGIYPNFIIRGGGLYVPSGNVQNIGPGYGLTKMTYSALNAPWCPIQMTNATATANVRAGDGTAYVGANMTVDNCNIVNTSGQACIFAEKGARITVTFTNNYMQGQALAGTGLLSANGGVIFVNGLPTLTGATADTRVDAAAQANAFYTGIGIVNPAAPAGNGGRIMRMS